jgi:hypothetical protein
MMDMRDRDNAPAPAPPISGAGAPLEELTANQMQAATRASKRRPGRPRGARSSDTVALLARLREYQDAGIDLLDALVSIGEDRKLPWGVRLAAMRHVCGAMLGRVGGPPT